MLIVPIDPCPCAIAFTVRRLPGDSSSAPRSERSESAAPASSGKKQNAGTIESDSDGDNRPLVKRPKLEFEVKDKLISELAFAKFTKGCSLAQFIGTRTTFAAQFSKAYALHGLAKNYFNKPDKEFAKVQSASDKDDLNYDQHKLTLQECDKDCKDRCSKITAWRQSQDSEGLQAQAIRDLEKLTDATAAFLECRESLSQIKAECTKAETAEWRVSYNKIVQYQKLFKNNDVNPTLSTIFATDLQKVVEEAAQKTKLRFNRTAQPNNIYIYIYMYTYVYVTYIYIYLYIYTIYLCDICI